MIIAVDGNPVDSFSEIVERLALSSGWTGSGERRTLFTIRREGQQLDLT